MSKTYDTCSERSYKEETKKEKSESKPKDSSESETKSSETTKTSITFNLGQILALSRDEKLIEMQMRYEILGNYN
jgi:hypothetical protein